jgi:hypothetical protein
MVYVIVLWDRRGSPAWRSSVWFIALLPQFFCMAIESIKIKFDNPKGVVKVRGSSLHLAWGIPQGVSHAIFIYAVESVCRKQF